MIRIAHFSDLHYGPKTLGEADRCFGAAIDRAIDLGAEAAVLSGDATDHALDLHAPAAERLLAQVRRLADHCPVLMLQGTFSHEPPGTLSIFRLLGGRYPVHVADRIGQVALTPRGEWLASPGWRFEEIPAGARALFSCIPTVNKAVVAATLGAAEAAQAVGEQLALLLRGYAPSHCAARRQGLPTIGVSHGTVFGCLSEHGVPMAGFDHEFTTGALFGAEAQAFMLGHIHRHQAWTAEGQGGGQCIAYPGAIGRFHYGEEDDKGFLLWEVGAEGACFTLVPTPARRTIDIVFEGKPGLEALRAAVANQDIGGACVRVRWTVADEDRHEVDRAAIERMLEAAAEVKLEGRIVPVVRTRAAGIAQLASLADKVRAWARVTQSQPAPLLACLDALAMQSPEGIADRVLRGPVHANSACAGEELAVMPGVPGAHEAGDVEHPHGGWCPAGRRAEDGTIPARYQLEELPQGGGYRRRTKANVRHSDATLIVSIEPVLTGGSKETRLFAQRLAKPCLHLHPAMDWRGALHDWLSATLD